MTVLGVVGGGTMGSGIAQLGSLAGCATTIVDPYADADAVLQRIERDLHKGATRGRWSEADAAAALGRLEVTDTLAALKPADVVIEAIPERLEDKHALFAALERLVRDECVLATNTSSLPVRHIAAPLRRPERVVGMHFFNPAPLMPLIEVVAGRASSPAALARVRSLGEAMGRRIIDAADGPGFLVNRCNRPFGLEALELLDAGVADPATIDRIVRLGGGFRMGPFELQDLVGIDVSSDVAHTLYALSSEEPRWKPNARLAQLAAEGRLGRKTGHGWYRYPPGAPDPPAEPPNASGRPGTVFVLGAGRLADELRALADETRWTVLRDAEPGSAADLTLNLTASDEEALFAGPAAVLVAASSLAARHAPGAVGLHAVPPLARGGLVEVTVGAASSEASLQTLQRLLADCGLHVAIVGDGPGLVLGRIVAQLVNEAAFALEARAGSASDIDAGMTLGVGHPRGPLSWGDLIGLEHVLAILDALHDQRADERYRAAPLLRRLVHEGRTTGLAARG